MSYARTITLTTSSTLTFPTRNEVYLIDATTGPSGFPGTVLTLPLITSNGMCFWLRRIDITSNVVTINASGGQLINGVSSLYLPGLSDTQIHSYNYNWYTVQGINPQYRGLPLNLRFTQPNGSGSESSSNTWFRAGSFVFRGLSIDTAVSSALVIGYTTNTNTYHRFRVYDRTNSTQIAITKQSNTGTDPTPVIIQFGPFTSLPASEALFEIQMLATDATGNTGVSGRQNIGIHTFQVYG